MKNILHKILYWKSFSWDFTAFVYRMQKNVCLAGLFLIPPLYVLPYIIDESIMSTSSYASHLLLLWLWVQLGHKSTVPPATATLWHHILNVYICLYIHHQIFFLENDKMSLYIQKLFKKLWGNHFCPPSLWVEK